MSYLFKDLLHTAAQIDQAISDLASHIANGVIHITAAERQEWNAKATTADVGAEAEARAQADGELQTAINAKASSADLTAEETARANADAKQVAALAELIDSGAKNRLKIAASSTTTNGVQITINADGTVTLDGTAQDKKATGNIYFQLGDVSVKSGDEIHLSGCPAGGSYSGSYAFYIDYAGGSTLAYDEGSGADYTATADRTLRCRIIIRSGTIIDNLIFKPMICSKAAWNISQTFVQYCPTLAELYALIQALQT